MASGKGLEFYYSSSSDIGFVQSYDRAGAAFRPLDLGGSIVRVAGTANIANLPATGVGIEFYYRTDGGHDEGQIQAYNRATSTLKPLTIGGSSVALSAASLGFFSTAPTTKPIVTGSRGANAALASLLTSLAGLGLLVDSSS